MEGFFGCAQLLCRACEAKIAQVTNLWTIGLSCSGKSLNWAFRPDWLHSMDQGVTADFLGNFLLWTLLIKVKKSGLCLSS